MRNNITIKLFQCALLLVIVTGCGASPESDKSSEPSDSKKVAQTKRQKGAVDARLIKLFKTEAALNTVASFEKVRAFRLPAMSFQQDQLDEYKTLSGPLAVEDSIGKKLAALLTDVNSYEWDRSKGCEPDYGVRLEFTKAGQKTDVLFCFGCDFLLIYENGEVGNGEDFDKIRNSLLEPLKMVFKDDAVIQGLK